MTDEDKNTPSEKKKQCKYSAWALVFKRTELALPKMRIYINSENVYECLIVKGARERAKPKINV